MLTVFTTEMIISLFAAVTVTALHILLERERERERERLLSETGLHALINTVKAAQTHGK